MQFIEKCGKIYDFVGKRPTWFLSHSRHIFHLTTIFLFITGYFVMHYFIGNMFNWYTILFIQMCRFLKKKNIIFSIWGYYTSTWERIWWTNWVTYVWHLISLKKPMQFNESSGDLASYCNFLAKGQKKIAV